MLQTAAALVLVTLATASLFAPGLLVVRRFRWTPLETLVAAVGLSLALLFVVYFAAFWTGAPYWAANVMTLAGALTTVVVWPDVLRLWQRAIVRRTVFSLAGLCVWTLLLLSLIRQYGGGDWCCDWLEHYQRTRHFIEPWPRDFLYIGLYLLPARPPLMNVVAAQILGQVGLEFWSYQIVFSLLNVLALLSACLASRLFSRTGRPADPRLVAVLLGANPMFFMNTTFAWTKGLTAFFALLALALYVVGWRKQDRTRLGAAFLALAAAVVTHYSAAPVAILMGVHYLIAVRPAHRAGLADLVRVAAPAVLLVGLWAGYAVTTFGLERGLLRNPSLEGTVDLSPADHIRTRALNLVDTFIPRRYAGYRGYPPDATKRRWVSDSVFTPYQSNAVLSMGSVNGLLIVFLATSALVRLTSVPIRRFWIWFVAFAWLGGVVVHGDRAESGVAMIALQPVTYLALAFLATRLPHLPSWIKGLWVGGTLVDLAFGIALAVWFEMGTGEWARTPNWDIKADARVLFLADYNPAPLVTIALLGLIAIAATVSTTRLISRRQARQYGMTGSLS